MRPKNATTFKVCLRCESRYSTRRAARSGLPLWSSPTRAYSRPSIAPKPTLDVKHIARNPGLYAQNCIDRNYKQLSQNPWKILQLTKERAESQKASQAGRENNNKRQKEIQRLQSLGKASGLERDQEQKLEELLTAAKTFKEETTSQSERQQEIEEQIEELALELPNLSSLHTPNGESPETIEQYKASEDAFNRHNTSHVDIGATLDLLDFAAAGTVSGWGWYYFKNEAALLEQALIQYTLSLLFKRGWNTISPPSITYSHIAAACGFQPRDQNGEQQVYQLQQPERDRDKPSLCLTATAEIPLAGMYAGKTIPEEQLPLKSVAVSRCYRAEAGARGVDTKGLYRVHEFTKVEMFAWTVPDDVSSDELGTRGPSQSEAVFLEMMNIQKEILQSLGLSFRVLEMPCTDLGAAAARKQDIEAYFPSRKGKDQGWGEVTSTSVCTDYQTRRLGTRVQSKNFKLDWPYTLNGTALAVPRIMAAILENGWNEEECSITIPKVLRPWMFDMDHIKR